ncbi:hypothetical protein N7449_011857 [Penicillium cf. viridicatum]|uniref:Uncharacterized protein n=1 Tax=Penicillium cf. viridicatum TaxID=2972119 RepID=A0A9W9IRG5_9EURO|nr:hypothetical protein N7449_011857 [Penicillium cf. viridicatum]
MSIGRYRGNPALRLIWYRSVRSITTRGKKSTIFYGSAIAIASDLNSRAIESDQNPFILYDSFKYNSCLKGTLANGFKQSQQPSLAILAAAARRQSRFITNLREHNRQLVFGTIYIVSVRPGG